MKNFTRILMAAGITGILGTVIMASTFGWGVKPLKDKKLRREMADECPESQRNSKGKCPPKSFRSFFFIPYGGGFRSGK